MIFYCDSSEFSQIHTGEAGTLRNVAPPRRDLGPVHMGRSYPG